MDQFFVPYRLKAIKKTNSGLIGKFTTKKIQIRFQSSFFYKTLFSLFLLFLSRLETGHFLYHSSINDKPPLQPN